MKRLTLFLGLALLSAAVLSAFRPSPETSALADGEGYDIGSEVANEKLKNVDGKMVAFADFADDKGLIVIFTCNTCPYAVAYEQRIIDLDKKYRELGYPVVAINPNDVKRQPGDSFEAMQQRAKEKGYTFPYLHDETQEVAKRFGATRTPHVYLLKKNNAGVFRVAFIGSIDDNYDDASQVENHFLEDAIKAVEAGQAPEPAKVKAIGCTIKWRES
jgi:peroxiredoxin